MTERWGKAAAYIRARVASERGAQKALAIRAGVPDATLHRWLTGKQIPDCDSAAAIAEALGMTLGQLLGEAPRPAPPAWEVYRLRVADVDLEAGTVASISRKDAAPSAVGLSRHPLPPGLRAELRTFVSRLPPGLRPEAPLLGIVSSRGGEAPERHPLTPFSLRGALRRACRRAGVPVVHGLGWLRNASATRLVESGETVETARRLLGHASSRTTERHYDAAALWTSREGAAGRLEAALAPPPPPTPRREGRGAADGRHATPRRQRRGTAAGVS